MRLNAYLFPINRCWTEVFTDNPEQSERTEFHADMRKCPVSMPELRESF